MNRNGDHERRAINFWLFQLTFCTLLFFVMVGLSGCGGGGGGGVSDSTKKIASFSVEPANNKWPVGYVKQFEACNVYTDKTIDSNKNLSVEWSSNSEAVHITKSGMANAIKVGVATITARSNDGLITGETVLTVTPNTSPPLNDAPVDVTAPPLNGAPVDVSGIWKGTYTIDDAVDKTQLGTYSLKFDLNQSNEGIVTGSSSLRYYDSNPTPEQVPFNDSAQKQAIGQFWPKAISGNKIDLSTLKYIDPITKINEMEDIVSALIIGNVMTGEVQENLKDSWHCHYTFTLKKQP